MGTQHTQPPVARNELNLRCSTNRTRQASVHTLAPRLYSHVSSQHFFQSYMSNLPTSLTNVLPLDERFVVLETWCGLGTDSTWIRQRVAPFAHKRFFRKIRRRCLHKTVCVFLRGAPHFSVWNNPCGFVSTHHPKTTCRLTVFLVKKNRYLLWSCRILSPLFLALPPILCWRRNMNRLCFRGSRLFYCLFQKKHTRPH